tara:strand:+ start:1055 stop:1819 length:765 start_codon:yes stop_codon:yes gene_type:complete
MNVLSYQPILDSISCLHLTEEVNKLHPIGTNKWIGIHDEPENIIEKYIQDSFDFFLLDKYNLWYQENPWNQINPPIGFEWWIENMEGHNTITYHSNHDDDYRRSEYGIMKYPLLSTQTYLTNDGCPTTILDTTHGDYWEEFVDYPPREITYSIPEQGKFLVSDPRYIRGVFGNSQERISLCYDVWHYKPKSLNRLGIKSKPFDCRFYNSQGEPPVQWLGKTRRYKQNLWDDVFTKYEPINYSTGETWKVTQSLR